MIYIIEANGNTNTGKYVNNIVSGTSIKVYTSLNNGYDQANAIPVFSNYNKAKSSFKLFFYVIGWIKIILGVANKSTLHFHWLKVSPIDFFFLALLKARKIKLVATVHNILPHEEKFFDNFFYGLIYRLCDTLIFHTNGIRNKFKAQFKLNKNSKLIAHYFDKVKIELDQEVPNSILFFGNIRPYKGLELLVSAISELETNLNWTLTIAGQPEYDIDELINKVAGNRSLKKKVNWILKWVDDEEMSKLFNKHQFVVMPYLEIDTSGLLYLAKSYKKVVIAPEFGIFSEMIVDSYNGFLFDRGNEKSLKEKLELCMASEDIYNIKGNISEEVTLNLPQEFSNLHSKFYDSL